MTQEIPDILRRICEVKRKEIARLRSTAETELRNRAGKQSTPRGFRDALLACKRVALIAEVKKASPSEGLIRADFDPAAIARDYEAGGARCLSVLTDEPFFQGKLDYLAQAREAVRLPVLRKDFLLDPLQVVQARAWGADCVLLIIACLRDEELNVLMQESRKLGMDTLVEAHDEAELERALSAGADLVGINNRDLHTFQVDLATTERLATLVPRGTALVAESGIHTRADITRLKSCGVAAVLVGTSLMRSADLTASVAQLAEV